MYYVYLFNCSYLGAVKIGFTSNLERREIELQKRFHYPDGYIEVAVPCKTETTARKLEWRLHRYFGYAHISDFGGSREWFFARKVTLDKFNYAVKRICRTWYRYDPPSQRGAT